VISCDLNLQFVQVDSEKEVCTEPPSFNCRELKQHGARIEFDQECGASFARSD
jgi:hypothetical protein